MKTEKNLNVGGVELKFSADEKTTDLISVICRISTELVENQEEMIIKSIREIGGERYEHITLDKNKVRDALENATARELKEILAYENMYVKTKAWACPKCGMIYMNNRLDNYCGECGQKFKKVKTNETSI